MRPDSQIRPYESTDRILVVELWKRTFPDDPPWNEPNLVIEQKLQTQPDGFFVALSGAKVAGTVLAGFDGVRGWIHHLAVDPDLRRQGIASQLVEAAEAWLAESGCPKLNLQVRAENEAATRFYESIGFQVEHRVSFGRRIGKWRDA